MTCAEECLNKGDGRRFLSVSLLLSFACEVAIDDWLSCTPRACGARQYWHPLKAAFVAFSKAAAFPLRQISRERRCHHHGDDATPRTLP